MCEEKLWLSEAMRKFNKEFYKGNINLLVAPAGSGKTTFLFKDFISDTYTYYKGANRSYAFDKFLDKILYVCDTSMLAESCLSENKYITESLQKGGLVEAKDSGSLMNYIENGAGTIKVITYSKLGMLLKSESCKRIIMKHFNCIMLDEFHNLFNYCNKYNVDKENNTFVDGSYIECINNLEELSKNVLTIAITATPRSIFVFREIHDNNFGIRRVFDFNEVEKIRTYNFDPFYTNCLMNNLKCIDVDTIRNNGYKIYINTSTIRQSKKYKEYLESIGLKTEWLCSVNNKTEVMNIDDNENEVTECIPTMNEYQKEIRNRLLYGLDDGTCKGTLPDDLECLIVNSGYETGWNLKDEKVMVCFIDNSNEDYQIQARNRIRHDIKALVVKSNLFDEDGLVLEKGRYGELTTKEKYLGENKYRSYYIVIPKIRKIDEKYIGYKLTSKMKDELVYKYGMKHLQLDNNFKNLKSDLMAQGYIVETDKHGTYIFRDDKKIKKDNKKEVRKMTSIDTVCDWLVLDWDKQLIPITEVRDILDLGRRTWDKIINNDDFAIFLEENNITMSTIKGRGKTVYFSRC